MAQITHFQNNEAKLADSCASELKKTIAAIKERLKQSPNLILPLEQSLDLVEQLSHFELGRFLLLNRGCNGYWTSYLTIPSLKGKTLHPLEKWFLTKAPGILSTQERFKIFQQQTQKHLKPNMIIASIPCGLMDDLLSLNYQGLEDIKIIGIDIDSESLNQAQNNSHNYSLKNKVIFLQKDAWELGCNNQFNLITSSGLSSYEPDYSKVIDLYKNFYGALCSQGILIIAFPPHPPPHPQSTWKPFNSEDLLLQKAIFSDILQTKWQNYRTEDQTRQYLKQVGFDNIDITYDTQGIYPTVVARKL